MKNDFWNKKKISVTKLLNHFPYTVIFNQRFWWKISLHNHKEIIRNNFEIKWNQFQLELHETEELRSVRRI